MKIRDITRDINVLQYCARHNIGTIEELKKVDILTLLDDYSISRYTIFIIIKIQRYYDRQGMGENAKNIAEGEG